MSRISMSSLPSLARAVLRLSANHICRASPTYRLVSSASSPPAPPSSSSASSLPVKQPGRPVVTEADTLTPAQLKAIQQLQVWFVFVTRRPSHCSGTLCVIVFRQELKREELEEADDGFVNSTTGTGSVRILLQLLHLLRHACSGERGGPKGPEPTRFGDWERKGRVSDF
jgi:hypothetical protein